MNRYRQVKKSHRWDICFCTLLLRRGVLKVDGETSEQAEERGEKSGKVGGKDRNDLEEEHNYWSAIVPSESNKTQLFSSP